jgi:hypothetical protein
VSTEPFPTGGYCSQPLLNEIFSYLITDYERRTFKVSQCTWNASASQNIKMISPLSTGSSTKSHIRALSTGAIAGISVGGAAVLIIIIIIIIRCRRRKPKAVELDASQTHDDIEKRGPYTKPELDSAGVEIKEADSTPITSKIFEMEASPGAELDGTQNGFEIKQHERYELPANEIPLPRSGSRAGFSLKKAPFSWEIGDTGRKPRQHF